MRTGRLQGPWPILQRICLALDLLAKAWLGALLVAVLVLMTGRALDRYFFHTTFDAYEQLACVGVVWITFYGFALAFRDDRNLRVELLENLLPASANRLRQIIFDVIILGMAGVLNAAGWPVYQVCATQRITGTVFTLAIAAAAMQFSTILICLLCLFRIVTGIAAFRGRRPAEAHQARPVVTPPS
jgi:TRAP-type C4-dicarboxylate transport system permease small subunit